MTQEHLLQCKPMIENQEHKYILAESEYFDRFGNIHQLKDILKCFIEILKVRETLVEIVQTGSGYSQVQYLQIKTTSQVQYLHRKAMSQVQSEGEGREQEGVGEVGREWEGELSMASVGSRAGGDNKKEHLEPRGG